MAESMKIDNLNDVGGVSAAGAKGAAALEGGARHEAGRGVDHGSDHAELSGLAGKISRVASREAVERAAEVERLRVEFAAGTYNPDPADVSRGIVKDSLASGAAAGGAEEK